MKKIISILLTVLIATTLLVACGTTEESATTTDTNEVAETQETEAQETKPAFYAETAKKDGTIIVATSPDYAPYESLDENGDIVGFDIDMMTEIEKYMDVTIEYKEMDFSMIISALQAGQVDLGVSCFSYSPERDVYFSTPYITAGQVAVVKDVDLYPTLESLKGNKIYAGAGTVGETAANEYGELEVVGGEDYLMGFEMLKTGAVKAVICDLTVGKEYAKTNGYIVLDEMLVEDTTSVIVKKGNDELLEVLNEAMDQYLASDAHTANIEKWEME